MTDGMKVGIGVAAAGAVAWFAWPKVKAWWDKRKKPAGSPADRQGIPAPGSVPKGSGVDAQGLVLAGMASMSQILGDERTQKAAASAAETGGKAAASALNSFLAGVG